MASVVTSHCPVAGSVRAPSSCKPVGMDASMCWTFPEEEEHWLFFFSSNSRCSTGVYICSTFNNHSHPPRKREGLINSGLMIRKIYKLGPGLSVTANESLSFIEASHFLLPEAQFSSLKNDRFGSANLESLFQCHHSKMLGLTVTSNTW